MSGKGLAYGLNLTKNTGNNNPRLTKRRAVFESENDSEDESETGNGARIETIEELDSFDAPKPRPTSDGPSTQRRPSKQASTSVYGDLSTSFTSRKHADVAAEVDANIYDYDAVYDSLKPQKKVTQQDKEKKPKYMSNLLAAAAVRKRDATIAEEKKLAREREAEGDEYADKEKFVTSAYKKQQEENRRLEEEEKIKEELERKKNKGAGMTRFYQELLEKGDEKHAAVVKAAEDTSRNQPNENIDEENKKSEADIAREISQKTGANIAINDEGQVVDKRDLLKGGLNIVAKPKSVATSHRNGPTSLTDRRRDDGLVGAGGGKQAMRERQSRMMEAQLEQATKRVLEEEKEEEGRIERASKSRKTNSDITSAKERYLARKKEAAESKTSAGK